MLSHERFESDLKMYSLWICSVQFFFGYIQEASSSLSLSPPKQKCPLWSPSGLHATQLWTLGFCIVLYTVL